MNVVFRKVKLLTYKLIVVQENAFILEMVDHGIRFWKDMTFFPLAPVAPALPATAAVAAPVAATS